MPIPVKDEYIFDGWYTEEIGGVKVDSSYQPTGDVTLYAHWNEAKKIVFYIDIKELNATLGEEFPVVARVEEIKDDKVIYDNVICEYRTLGKNDFYGYVPDIDGAEIRVTLLYSGANYYSKSNLQQTIDPLSEDEVTFELYYNNTKLGNGGVCWQHE